MREKIKDLALKESDLSPRELAVQFTDTEKYFVSEASVYRILKSYDLITSPAYVVLSAADEFRDKTSRPNQLWQTDFTYLKVIGWSWFYLSTILDDYSRYIIAWKLCKKMKTEDVTDTLDLVRGVIRQRSCTSRACSATMGLVTYLTNWPVGLRIRRWTTSEALRITRRPRARSNVGTRPSRTAFCLKITAGQEISGNGSTPSSSTTTIDAITRVCRT